MAIKANKDVVKDYQAFQGVCKENAEKYGKDLASLFGLSILTKSAVNAFVSIVTHFWVRADKGGAHKGHMEIALPSGKREKITRDLLPEFFGTVLQDDTLAKRAGGTVQKLLQVYGAAYAKFGADVEAIVKAFTDIAPEEPTPNGLLKEAKAETAPDWCAPLRKKEGSEPIKAFVDSLVKRLSYIGQTETEFAKFKGNPPEWYMDITAEDLKPIVLSMGRAVKRCSKRDGTLDVQDSAPEKVAAADAVPAVAQG